MATYDGLSSGATPAIKGTTAAGSNVVPVQGHSTDGNGVYGGNAVAAYGAVAGVNTAASGYGVYGEANGTSASGIYGFTSGSSGQGVRGIATGETSIGVRGDCSASFGAGVSGSATANSGTAFGVYGYSQYSAGYAGYFAGRVEISNGVSAASANAGIKSFVIDHPLDPENKRLRHSCVESPERKNVYDGIGIADASGDIVVTMPAYFEALNDTFRYQLTAVGQPAPGLYIKHELSDGHFVIGGAAAGQRISWQLTGTRRDALARANPLVVEEEKSADERGLYHYPEAHGQPEERGIVARHQALAAISSRTR